MALSKYEVNFYNDQGYLLVEDVISEGAEAVIILCTNLAGAGIISTLEKRTGVPILDSVVLTIWGAFRSIGLNTNPLVIWCPAVSKLRNK